MKQKIPWATFQNREELAEGMENSSHYLCKDGRIDTMTFFPEFKVIK